MTLHGVAALLVLAAGRECSLCKGGQKIGHNAYIKQEPAPSYRILEIGPIVWEPCPFCEGSGFQPLGVPDFYEGGAEWLDAQVDDLP